MIPLRILGLALFVAAWFLPVHHVLDETGEDRRRPASMQSPLERSNFEGPIGGSGPQGLRAARVAWRLLGDPDSKEAQLVASALTRSSFESRLLGATVLSNGLVLAAAFALLMAAGAQRLFAVLLLGAAGLDSAWCWIPRGEFVSELLVGYWVWLGSFVLLGLSFLAGPRAERSGV